MFVVLDSRDEMVYGPFNTRAQAAKWKDIEYDLRMRGVVVEVEDLLGVSTVVEQFPDVRMCPWFEYGKHCIRSEAHGGQHDYTV